MISNASLEKQLYDLTTIAWGPRCEVATEAFVLRPETLPVPACHEDVTRILESLFTHARRWCPGFKIPDDVSDCKPPLFTCLAWNHRADSGNASPRELPREVSRHPAMVHAIVAHEACHHILDLSGISAPQQAGNERQKALTVFICGFGEVFLQGYRELTTTVPSWITSHGGQLTEAQYRFAQSWVLRTQRIPGADHELLDKSIPKESQRCPGLFARMMAWLRGRTRSEEIVDAIPSPRTVRSVKRPLSPSNTIHYETALVRLGGNRATLERLIEYERRKQPYADESTLLQAVMESFERDRS